MTKLEEIAKTAMESIKVAGSYSQTEAAILAVMREQREEFAKLAASMYLYSGVDIADAIRRWGEE